MESRAVSFPSGASYGDIHSEHGRSWEYTEPGIWRSLGTGDGGGGSYDDTQIRSDLEAETEARTAGDKTLQDQVDALESSIIDGVIDAPNDGKLYGRQSSSWAEVVIPDAVVITYTLPVALRSGAAQLPLTLDGKKLAVMTRGGEIELPLAA